MNHTIQFDIEGENYTAEENMKTLEIADAYGATLQEARRLSEKEKKGYAEWFRNIGLISTGKSLEINVAVARSIVAGKPADGKFLGCENRAWIITDEQWDAAIILSREAEEKEKAEINREEHLTASGFCHFCGTWCCGDCGAGK